MLNTISVQPPYTQQQQLATSLYSTATACNLPTQQQQIATSLYSTATPTWLAMSSSSSAYSMKTTIITLKTFDNFLAFSVSNGSAVFLDYDVMPRVMGLQPAVGSACSCSFCCCCRCCCGEPCGLCRADSGGRGPYAEGVPCWLLPPECRSGGRSWPPECGSGGRSWPPDGSGGRWPFANLISLTLGKRDAPGCRVPAVSRPSVT